jgi:type II secretory pathway component PulF
MVSYRYTARDPEGHRVDGHLEAASVGEARRRLELDGFQVLEVIQTEPPSGQAAPGERLSLDEAQELVENVAQLSAAKLPLAPGLRAAGDECESGRLKRALDYLADQLDRGRPLEEVLASSSGLLPVHVSGLIRAAAQTSGLGSALTELVEHYRNTTTLWRNIGRALAYPLLVAGLATAVLVFILGFVGGNFERLFDDFETDLPMITKVFFAWRRFGLFGLPAVLALAAGIALLARWRLGRVGWHRWLSSAPLVGPLWHWLGLLEWIGLVRVLVRYEVTLLEALRLAAAGVSNANVGRLSLSLAEGVARGRSLSQTIASQRQIPASLVPLIRWGEEAGGLAESLEMGREMLEERVRLRSLWLETALPPGLFVAIGCCVLLVVGALLMPLISLVQNLT